MPEGDEEPVEKLIAAAKGNRWGQSPPHRDEMNRKTVSGRG
jgi:hypothetical protein